MIYRYVVAFFSQTSIGFQVWVSRALNLIQVALNLEIERQPCPTDYFMILEPLKTLIDPYKQNEIWSIDLFVCTYAPKTKVPSVRSGSWLSLEETLTST